MTAMSEKRAHAILLEDRNPGSIAIYNCLKAPSSHSQSSKTPGQDMINGYLLAKDERLPAIRKASYS